MRLPNDPALETPVKPFPDPREAPPTPTPDPPPRAGSLAGAVGAAFGYMRRAWRVLLLIVFVQLLLAATVVVPVQAGLAKHLDHHVHAPALGGAPDAYDRSVGWAQAGVNRGVLQDALRLEKPRMDAAAVTLFWIVLVAWLFGAVVAGGVLGTLRIQRGAVPVSAFLAAGGANFFRMLRVGIAFAVIWVIALRVVLDLWGSSVEPDELLASSEAVGWWGERTREAVLVLFFLWLRVASDLARVDLGLGGRKSALVGVLRGFARTVRHPIRIPGIALIYGLPAFAGVVGIGLLLDVAEGHHWLAWLVTFLLIQVAVAIRWAGRCAVLAGNARLLGADRPTAA